MSSYQREVADVCLFSSSVCEFLWSLQDWLLSWSNTAVASFFHRFPPPSRAFPRSFSSLGPDFAPIPLFKFWARTLKLISPDPTTEAGHCWTLKVTRAQLSHFATIRLNLIWTVEKNSFAFHHFLAKRFRRSSLASDHIWEFYKGKKEHKTKLEGREAEESAGEEVQGRKKKWPKKWEVQLQKSLQNFEVTAVVTH